MADLVNKENDDKVLKNNPENEVKEEKSERTEK